jgi:putative ABC transport system permease protein
VSAARRPVTDVVRDVPRDRVSWLNRRSASVPRRLSLLGIREALSRPTSGAFAALAVVVAVVGTLVSIGFVRGIDAVAADPARAGDPWDVALVRGDLAPATVEGALGQTAGVAGWFTEVGRRSTFRGGAFLSVATGGDPAAAAYQIASGLPLTREGEAIAGYGFLQRFDVSVGDRVDVLVGTTPLTLTIVGEYRDTEDSGEILRYRFEDLARLEPGLAPSMYRVAAAPGTPPAALAADLAARLGPGVRVEVLDTGVDDMGPLMAVLQLIAVVLVVMAGTNLLSTLLTATRESAGRVGVQLAVGFTPRQIVGQGAMAGAFTGAVAAAVGVPLGLLVFRVLADGVSTGIGVGPGWMPLPPASALVLVPLAAVLLSAVLGATAVARTARRPASDLVRGE